MQLAEREEKESSQTFLRETESGVVSKLEAVVLLAIGPDAVVLSPRHVALTSVCRSSVEFWESVERSECRLLGVVIDERFNDGTGVRLSTDLRRKYPLVPIALTATQISEELLQVRQRYDVLLSLGDSEEHRFSSAIESVASTPFPGWDAVEVELQRFASSQGLSPSELRIVASLARGSERSELLEELGVSNNTLKTQVRSILRKTSAESLHEVSRRVLINSLCG